MRQPHDTMIRLTHSAGMWTARGFEPHYGGILAVAPSRQGAVDALGRLLIANHGFRRDTVYYGKDSKPSERPFT